MGLHKKSSWEQPWWYRSWSTRGNSRSIRYQKWRTVQHAILFKGWTLHARERTALWAIFALKGENDLLEKPLKNAPCYLPQGVEIIAPYHLSATERTKENYFSTRYPTHCSLCIYTRTHICTRIYIKIHFFCAVTRFYFDKKNGRHLQLYKRGLGALRRPGSKFRHFDVKMTFFDDILTLKWRSLLPGRSCVTIFA